MPKKALLVQLAARQVALAARPRLPVTKRYHHYVEWPAKLARKVYVEAAVK